MLVSNLHALLRPMPPYKPPRLLASPLIQTIAGTFLRTQAGVTFQRHRLQAPDGDFLHVDEALVAGAALNANAPVVLLLHGLEGSARRGYACEMYRQLARRGIRSLGLNFRSCSGEMNQTARMYHAGATDDVALTLDWLAGRYPGATFGAVGFSLGANVLLKYLGEGGRHLQTAVAISPPFDLLSGSHVLRRPLGRLLSNHFLRKLRQKVRAHAPLIHHQVNVAQALAAPDLWTFDDVCTAPLHGFQSAVDYYLQNSSGRFLPHIAIPTLLLRALDDPFFSESDIPYAIIHANPNLHLALTPHGGHVGFWAGGNRWWAEAAAANFMARHLEMGYDEKRDYNP